jgi:hypothetical protein
MLSSAAGANNSPIKVEIERLSSELATQLEACRRELNTFTNWFHKEKYFRDTPLVQ